jgi:signal transduction histidine kinase
MISHEMNNPLAVSMGFLQLLMLNDQCTGKIRTDLEKVRSEMGRLVLAVERLHHYAHSLQEASADSLPKSLAG